MKEIIAKVVRFEVNNTRCTISAKLTNPIEHDFLDILEVKGHCLEHVVGVGYDVSIWVKESTTITSKVFNALITPQSITGSGLTPFSSKGIPAALLQIKKYNLSPETINLLQQAITPLLNSPKELIEECYSFFKRINLHPKSIHQYTALILRTAFLHAILPYWSIENKSIDLFRLVTSLPNKVLIQCWDNPLLLSTRYRIISGADSLSLSSFSLGFNAPDHHNEYICSLSLDALESVEKKIGATFYPLDSVCTLVSKYIYTSEKVREHLIKSVNDDLFLLLEHKGAFYISRKSTAEKEKFVLNKLKRIIASSGRIHAKCNNDKFLDKFLESEGVTLEEGQISTFKKALNSSVLMLTGEPGTGKTFLGVLIIKYIIECLNIPIEDVLLLAPTGIVSQKLSNLTGMQGKTIHRALGMYFNDEESSLGINENIEISANVILIDETSMPNLDMFYSLFKAIRDDAKIILVGDPEQLPSIGCGKVFSDLIKYHNIPHSHLSTNRRVKQESSISKNSKLIVSDPMNFELIVDEDTEHLIAHSAEELAKKAEQKLKSLLEKTPPSSIVILTPWHKGDLGTVANNLLMQKLLINNGTLNTDVSISMGNYTFYIGDTVLINKTDYVRDIYNGDIGLINKITNDSKNKITVFVSIRNKSIPFTLKQVQQLSLGYSMTPHKIQGGEVDNVVITIPKESLYMLSREWLLTAMTRAKKKCIIISTLGIISEICIKSASKNRTTYLQLKGEK
jgi:RecD/TraA family predicted helicase